MFHRIWLSDGRQELPPSQYEDNWNAWKRQYPDQEFKTWTDNDVADFERVAPAISKADGMPRKADILRYAILERHGGVYLDCDIEPYHRRLEFQNLTEMLVCNEDDNTSYCSIGFIASPSAHPLFDGLLNEIVNKPLNQTTANIETGPHFFGEHVNRSNRIHRLPPIAFYPYHFTESRSATLSRSLDETQGIHQWGGSWLTTADREKVISRRVLQNDAFEIEEAVKRLEISEASPFVVLSRDLRRARESYSGIALQHFGSLGGFDLSTQHCFGLLKIAFWLQKQNHRPIVWQIGAADGIVADPIRPFLIGCDPVAVLLEPNPWMFARLEKHYSKNTNIKLVPAALVEAADDFTMNCVVPDEVDRLQLPEWVLGISSMYSNRNVLDGRDIDPALHTRILQSVRRQTVQGLTVEAVCELTGTKLPDILVVDAEGMDSKILMLILGRGAKPCIIHFEHCNLTQEEKGQLDRILRNDYITFIFGNDATAVRKDVLLAYSSSIWIEHGIQGIFARIFEQINPFKR